MLSVVKGLMFFAPILAKDPFNYQLGDLGGKENRLNLNIPF